MSTTEWTNNADGTLEGHNIKNNPKFSYNQNTLNKDQLRERHEQFKKEIAKYNDVLIQNTIEAQNKVIEYLIDYDFDIPKEKIDEFKIISLDAEYDFIEEEEAKRYILLSEKSEENKEGELMELNIRNNILYSKEIKNGTTEEKIDFINNLMKYFKSRIEEMKKIADL